MPELPEVETVRRVLEKMISGRRIQSVRIDKPKMLRGQSQQRFIRELVDQIIMGVERRAKYLLIRLKTGTLMIHLGMSGQVLVESPQTEPAGSISNLPDKHTHLQIFLDKGFRLFGRDPRMFGRYQYWTDEEEAVAFSKLGPEPLGRLFSVDGLYRRIRASSSSLKALLLNQTVVAGLGNIYADESLFQAKLSPFLPGKNIRLDQARRLYAAIRMVLRKAVFAGGTSISDYLDPRHRKGAFQWQLQVYAREGEPCRICRTIIQKQNLAQRGTHWCPRCQKMKEK